MDKPEVPAEESEAALLGDAVAAFRRVEHGCPSMPRYAHRALEASRELIEMHLDDAEKTDGRRLRRVS